jgi:hypothetical protein
MVARFVFDTRHFSGRDRRIKASAFMPIDGATSVFQINELTEEQIWALGVLAGQLRGKLPYVRGDLPIERIRETSLEVVIDNDPQYHGAIVNWPAGKEDQIAKAQELSRIVSNFAERPS